MGDIALAGMKVGEPRKYGRAVARGAHSVEPCGGARSLYHCRQAGEALVLVAHGAHVAHFEPMVVSLIRRFLDHRIRRSVNTPDQTAVLISGRP
ncbi:hypothetical protein OG322_05335 [Streptomyces sp. NBC_01260]|uniref:hypothetical protein n=1 Tax=unclassified Streptomyces TaxID=2593676 RepID=UPI0011CDD691|nr:MULTISPECIES: hypothetical protein [unclassified Streptomyces]